MQKYTLKELADIGAKRAHSCLDGYCMQCNANAGNYKLPEHENARIAFAKAILDAIGYEFPKDEEREAFDAWWKDNRIAYCNEDHAFQLWKSAREELRKAQSLDKQSNEPAWIPWSGGECPIPDTVKRWEYKLRHQLKAVSVADKPSDYDWRHRPELPEFDIIAYRVWE